MFYQVPVGARKLPLVLWHGAGQFSKTWETTPDGREGYQTIFLRRGFGVYVIDQPRRGDAGRSTQPVTITPTPDEQRWFDIFRVGTWPNHFSGVQFPRDPGSLNQYFRQMTPNTGPFDGAVVSTRPRPCSTGSGPASSSPTRRPAGRAGAPRSRAGTCGRSWPTNRAAASSSRRGRAPPPMQSANGPLQADSISLPEFQRLTEIPIIVFYGDNIPDTPVAEPGQDQWRVRLEMARLWRMPSIATAAT